MMGLNPGYLLESFLLYQACVAHGTHVLKKTTRGEIGSKTTHFEMTSFMDGPIAKKRKTLQPRETELTRTD